MRQQRGPKVAPPAAVRGGKESPGVTSARRQVTAASAAPGDSSLSTAAKGHIFRNV